MRRYRPLNDMTIKDQYQMPRIDEIIDELSNARIFTALDATKGYYLIAIRERIKLKPHSDGRMGFMNLIGCHSACAMHRLHFKEPWTSY